MTSELPKLRDMGGVKSPYYRPAPWGDKRLGRRLDTEHDASSSWKRVKRSLLERLNRLVRRP